MHNLFVNIVNLQNILNKLKICAFLKPLLSNQRHNTSSTRASPSLRPCKSRDTTWYPPHESVGGGIKFIGFSRSCTIKTKCLRNNKILLDEFIRSVDHCYLTYTKPMMTL